MTEQDGARRVLEEAIRQGIRVTRQNTVATLRMTTAYASREALRLVPTEGLAAYEHALREGAEAERRLAEAIRAEIDSR